MSALADFLAHFRLQRRWSHELFAAVPEQHFDWAPAPSAFSCGGLLVHLIQSEVFWRRLLVAGARGEPYDPLGLHGSGRERFVAFREPNLETSRSDRFGRSFAACLASWSAVGEKTQKELAEIPTAGLARTIEHPISLLSLTVGQMCWVMIEHEAHHRGQLSAYLKVLGVEQPPVFT